MSETKKPMSEAMLGFVNLFAEKVNEGKFIPTNFAASVKTIFIMANPPWLIGPRGNFFC